MRGPYLPTILNSEDLSNFDEYPEDANPPPPFVPDATRWDDAF